VLSSIQPTIVQSGAGHLYEAEKRRRGESFRIIDFMDTVLRTGPVPSDELPGILEARDLVPTPQ